MSTTPGSSANLRITDQRLSFNMAATSSTVNNWSWVGGNMKIWKNHSFKLTALVTLRSHR